MRTLRLTLAGLLLLASSPVTAGGSAGAESLNFLFLDANARAVALSGAYTALAYDSNALLYNPAGLGRVARHEATFMHSQYVASVTQEYAAYAGPLGLGLNLNYLNSGAVARTTISNPDGTALGYTNLSDFSVGAGYGRSFGDLSLGAGGKYISESIAGISGNTYAFDVGALYLAPFLPGLSLGLAFQNMGRPIKFQLGGEELPLSARFGAAYVFTALGNKNTLSVDVTKERNESFLVGAGAETVILESMALRLGFNNRNTVGTGLTGGVGWTYKDLSVDYALAAYGALGLTHRVSATVRWGGRPEEPAAPAAESGPRERLDAADRLLASKDYEGAKAQLARAAAALGENDPLRVRVLERLGTAAWDEKDEPAAKSAYLESVSLADRIGLRAPDLADTYAKLALCWLAEKNAAEAANAFNQGLKKSPSAQTRRFIEEQLLKLREP